MDNAHPPTVPQPTTIPQMTPTIPQSTPTILQQPTTIQQPTIPQSAPTTHKPAQPTITTKLPAADDPSDDPPPPPPTLWVFGYGSLLWKPDFRFCSKRVGYIEGYCRRFYQGNETFRGRPGQPGRVANLVEQKGSRAWGVAYEIKGHEEVTKVTQALYTRETACGGYVTMVTDFFPRDHHGVTSRKCEISGGCCQLQEERESMSMSKLKYGYYEFGNNVGSDGESDDSSSKSSDDMMLDGESDDDDDTDVDSDNEMANFGDIESDISTEEEEEEDMFDISELFKDECEYLSVSTSTTPHFSTTACNNSKNNRLTNNSSSKNPPSIRVLVYTVTPDNALYMGHDDVTVMAEQIVSASGSAGSNVEYVTRIADFVKEFIPEDDDLHLFELDCKVREILTWRRSGSNLLLDLPGSGSTKFRKGSMMMSSYERVAAAGSRSSIRRRSSDSLVDIRYHQQHFITHPVSHFGF